jgi:hypothetical protein
VKVAERQAWIAGKSSDEKYLGFNPSSYWISLTTLNFAFLFHNVSWVVQLDYYTIYLAQSLPY